MLGHILCDLILENLAFWYLHKYELLCTRIDHWPCEDTGVPTGNSQGHEFVIMTLLHFLSQVLSILPPPLHSLVRAHDPAKIHEKPG